VLLVEPSSFVVVAVVLVVVEPSWFWTTVEVWVVTAPFPSTMVWDVVFATYVNSMSFVVV
jgi:hypothetical protein